MRIIDMKKLKYIIAGAIAAIAFMLAMPSCVDFSYDDIEPRIDSTTLEANTTIAELKGIYPGELFKITSTTFAGRDSVLIEGRIISSDKEGNIYKSLFIEDGTAGIEIKLNKTTLYNDYKLGQKVVVYCNGLHLGDYGGQIQLGSSYSNNGVIEISSLEGDVIIKKHVFKKGKNIEEVTPIVMTPTLLNPANIGRLVQFDNVQIKDTLSLVTGLTYTYADAVNKVTLNHELKSQIQSFTSTIVLRTSGYARFSGTTINTKQGTIVGILTYYNRTYQLIIRDLADVKFDQPRFQI
ncbi:MAG TPA: DUF5689 domain-containing protein [Tenuifilaceae bacterium]|nr:DUF5689 domain-containing protein [Tenuifilaceae bacterium]